MHRKITRRARARKWEDLTAIGAAVDPAVPEAIPTSPEKAVQPKPAAKVCSRRRRDIPVKGAPSEEEVVFMERWEFISEGNGIQRRPTGPG